MFPKTLFSFAKNTKLLSFNRAENFKRKTVCFGNYSQNSAKAIFDVHFVHRFNCMTTTYLGVVELQNF